MQKAARGGLVKVDRLVFVVRGVARGIDDRAQPGDVTGHRQRAVDGDCADQANVTGRDRHATPGHHRRAATDADCDGAAGIRLEQTIST